MLGVKLKHFYFDFVTDLECLVDVVKPFPTYVADMQQTVDMVVEFDKCAEGQDASDLTYYACAYGELLGCNVPGLGLQLLVAQGNAILFAIECKHDKFVGFADFQHVGRIVDMEPSKVAGVCAGAR